MGRTAAGNRLVSVAQAAVRGLVATAALLSAVPAFSEDIAEVLWRSHAERLATLPQAEPGSGPVQVLRRDLERLAGSAGPAAIPVALQVVLGGTLAETVQGRIIVVSAALGDWPRDARWFVLAHELCHVREAHWDERVRLYRRFIPGNVDRAQTDGVANELGAAASRQSHLHEHRADACAMTTMLERGYSEEQLLSMLPRLCQRRATATHPSLGQRISHLRTLVERRAMAARPGGAPNQS